VLYAPELSGTLKLVQTLTTMRTLAIIAVLLSHSLLTFAQVEAIPTFKVISKDVVQGSIMVFRMNRTNDASMTVKFAFSDAGAKRLEVFYRTHSVGQQVRYQIGAFERVFHLDDRKHFGREGFWSLTERDAKALEAGLKGTNWNLIWNGDKK
jgi:hypothetical protein